MRFRKYFVCIFLLFVSTNLLQASQGCLLSDGKVYYPYLGAVLILGTRVYDISNSYSTTPHTCPGWVTYPSLGGPCGVGLNIAGLISLSLGGGNEVDYTYIACDLDDYTWTFGAAAGLFGVFVIRRRNKL